MPRQRLKFGVNPAVIVVALVVTAADAATKFWARHALSAHAYHVAADIWLRLQYNSGISFSINQSGPLLTTIATIVVAIVAVVIGVRAQRGAPTAGFGLLLGGGVANVIDRLAANPHQVTDFIAVGNFPVFNLADAAITVGFIVLLVCAVRGQKLLVS